MFDFGSISEQCISLVLIPKDNHRVIRAIRGHKVCI